MKTQITITNSTTLNDLPDVLTVATLAAYLHTTRQNICKMLIRQGWPLVPRTQGIPAGVFEGFLAAAGLIDRGPHHDRTYFRNNSCKGQDVAHRPVLCGGRKTD